MCVESSKDKKEEINEEKDDSHLVTVIIPVYKVEEYLKRCLDSVICQTYQNLEIILVDDGSPDRCGAICNEYAEKDARVHVIHKENGGLSSARNAGLAVANGKYITFVDSDDCVALDMVAYLYQLLKDYDADISACLYFIARGARRWKSYDLRATEVIGSKECVSRFLYDDGISTSAWAKLYKKEIFRDIRFPERRLFEDVGTIYLTFLAAQKIVVGTGVKYDYMLRENSIVSRKFDARKLDMIDMTEQMTRDILDVYPDLEKGALRRRVYARFSTLNQMLSAGSEWDAKRQEIIAYIKSNACAILIDRKVPARDKIAILLLFMGYGIYKFIWLHVGKK